MSQKLVLIDGHSILNRAFYGVPDLSNAEGLHTNAIYGFLNIMFKILEEEKPEYLAVAFDVHAPTFRHKMYEAYKGTRKPMPEELREQVPVMKEILKAMHITIMEQAGLEADDILGTLAKKAEQAGLEVSLVSGDRDLLQIATDHIKIRIPKTKQGRTEIEDYYAADVLAAYQVTPLQFIELKALMGDTADNIPGVPKVGEKTAQALMVEYGSLDNIYAHVEEISKKSIRESLIEHKDLADLSKTLATIKTDCELQLDYEQARAEGFYTPEAYTLCKRLEFKNLLGRFEKDAAANDSKIAESFRQIEDKKEFLQYLKKAQKQKEIGLWLITEPVDATTKKEELLGVALSVSDEETVFYALIHEKEPEGQLSLFAEAVESVDDTAEITEALQELSAGTDTQIATFDVKHQYDYLDRSSTEQYFDVLIAAYLLNPLKNDYDMEAIASEHLGILIPGRAEVFGKRDFRTLLSEDAGKAMEYACYGAYVSRKGKKVLKDKLEAAGMKCLMEEMEMPLSLVLYDMQKEGVAVKREELKAYGDALVARIEELEQSIHTQAGTEFNINSPKQLGDVLFGKLELPAKKKTKSGYSTNAEVLEELIPYHPIISKILEYRKYKKLSSTYVEGLKDTIGPDSRIRSVFRQTDTRTGRISSAEPNMQNIPIRTEPGSRMRDFFEAEEGNLLVDADYSQIELRVLAALANDSAMIEAFREGVDIHTRTAAQVFDLPEAFVTPQMRSRAKAVNFGIVYGIGAFSLSRDIGVSMQEADTYIKNYKKTYSGIAAYLERAIEDAKEKGYAETLFGRRRPLPELKASNRVQRAFGERVAMNAPIQGTAADIIKIAMVRVYRRLKEEVPAARLILQVHDELIVETPQQTAEQVRELVRQEMESAVSLSVPLLVDAKVGKTWGEAH